VIAALLTRVATQPWLRAALRNGAIALAAILFLPALQCIGERAGRRAEHLETTEKANDVQRQICDALAIARKLMSGCAAEGSETGIESCSLTFTNYSRKVLKYATRGSVSARRWSRNFNSPITRRWPGLLVRRHSASKAKRKSPAAVTQLFLHFLLGKQF
jgi:hypothetical protein